MIGARRPRHLILALARRLARAAALVALLWLAYVGILLRPSNQRSWEFGMDTLPHLTISAGSVLVQGLRDFHYAVGVTRSADYLDRAFDLNRIERVWFVQEPFTIKPLSGFKGVAHTYFVFDFQDQPPLAISVEARREKGEVYDAIVGLFNQFELIYVWATEADLTGRRAVLEKNPLYMYPLAISTEAARALLLQLAKASQDLESHPRFYNTLISNCTNELAKAANNVKSDAIPLNRALVFPGYSNEVLYKLGYIPNDAPMGEIDRRYYITDLVIETYEQPDFSQLLRAALKQRATTEGAVGSRSERGPDSSAPAREGPATPR